MACKSVALFLVLALAAQTGAYAQVPSVNSRAKATGKGGGDDTACLLTCPANFTDVAAPGICGKKIKFAPVATGECGGDAVCEPSAENILLVGQNTVRCSSLLGDSSCSFSATITDTELPKVTCPGNINKEIPSGSSSSVVVYATSSSDNCPGVVQNCFPASGSVFGLGETEVKCKVDDTSGNSAACSFKVTLTEAPLVTPTATPEITVTVTPVPTLSVSPSPKGSSTPGKTPTEKPTATHSSTKTPSPSPSATATQAVQVLESPSCTSGGVIRHATLSVKNFAGNVGDEILSVKGRLSIKASLFNSLNPLLHGAQIALIANTKKQFLYELSGRTTSIPPGAPGTGCGFQDGWSSLTYKNFSGSLGKGLCSQATANGLSLLSVTNTRRGKRIEIKTGASAISSVVDDLVLGVVFGATNEQGKQGQCAVGTFKSTRCKLKKGTLTCKN